MSTLYDIDNRLYSLLDEETGEITDLEAFEQIQLEREKKIENIALWVKNLKADVMALKAEKQAFADRQKAAEKKIDSLRKLISDALGGQPLETPRVKLSFRKSAEVQIDDKDELPDEYLRYKT
ncbi:MAG: siphovirus Gp157 family protein [[Eubacterium] siraeum]